MSHKSHQETHNDLKRVVAQRNALMYQIREIQGCFVEYEAMPCTSLKSRLGAAVDRAMAEIERIKE